MKRFLRIKETLLLGLGMWICTFPVQAAASELRVYMSDWQAEEFAPVLEQFQKNYPDIELTLDVYKMEDGFLNAADKLATELMAGKGPDLLISDNVPTGDVKKLLKSGVFAPMDEFINQDASWNTEDYIMPVIEGGKFDGVQYVMPLSYDPVIMVSSKEAMAEMNLTEEVCIDTPSLMKAVAAMYDTEYTERILAEGVQLFSFPVYLDGIFLDYNEGEITTDPQIMQEACEAYAKMYEEDAHSISMGYADAGKSITERNAYVYFPGTAGVYGFIASEMAIAAKETPAIIPLRTIQGETLAEVETYAGISANSENKQAAWNLLKMFLTEEGQKAHTLSNGNYPVLRSAFEAVLQSEIQRTKEKNIEVSDLSEEFLTDAKEIICNPQKCLMTGNISGEKFQLMMEPFYYGEASYEECMQKFQSFAKIYLTE